MPNVEVSIYTVRENFVVPPERRALTDENGRYEGFSRKGNVRAIAWRVPEGYLTNVPKRDPPRVEATEDVLFPDITLERSTRIEGLVVDGAGKPVAGAEVHVLEPDRPDRRSVREPTLANNRGEFRLENVDPIDTLPIRAAAEDTVTDGALVVVPKEINGRLRLVTSPNNAFRIRGRVVGRGGQPVKDGNVVLAWQRKYVSTRTEMAAVGSYLQTLQTSEEGTFQTRALWPGDRYSVTISAEGFSSHQSKYVTAEAGKVYDIGTVTLASTSGYVEGRVVDSAGNPLPNVRVFNSGDALDLVETRTDKQGNFRLEGLPKDLIYVFTQMSGYRFGGAAAQPGVNTVEIRLLRSDEPPPRSPRPSLSLSFEGQKQVSRRLIEQMLQLPERQWRPARRVLLESLARLDPNAAYELSAKLGERPDRVDQVVARQRLRDVAETTDDVLNEVLVLLNGANG